MGCLSPASLKIRTSDCFLGNLSTGTRVLPPSAATDGFLSDSTRRATHRSRSIEEWAMHSNRKPTLLRLAVVIGLGLFAAGTTRAEAHKSGKKKGWHKKQGHKKDYRRFE